MIEEPLDAGFECRFDSVRPLYGEVEISVVQHAELPVFPHDAGGLRCMHVRRSNMPCTQGGKPFNCTAETL